MALGAKTFNLFQFHKGAIRTSERQALLSSLQNFNSIKVRLEPWYGIPEMLLPVNFNSIKVRLERFSF